MHPQDIDPVVYGDAAGQLLFVATRPEHPLVRDFNKRMEGKQQGLWEHISADPKEAVQTGKVIPYRNTHEDRGSISYMVPKSAIRSGKVKYAGVTDLTKDDLRKKIEQEERLYD